jgi:hypothetical protein
VQDTSAIVGEDEKDVEDAKGRGGHGEMSIEEREPIWLSRKVRQVCEGGLRAVGGMKRETLRSPISMPSLSNSP